jgi:hypothetical protein
MEDIFYQNFIPLVEGNMLYLISNLIVEYLDCQYRWKFRTSSPNLMRYFDILKVYAFALHMVRFSISDCRTLNPFLIRNYCRKVSKKTK